MIVNTRDGYAEKLKARLDQWDAELDKLDTTAVKAEGDAKIRRGEDQIEVPLWP